MKLVVRYMAIVWILGAGLAADAAPQTRARSAASAEPKMAVENSSDYALTLKDPFSPIGYLPPVPEW